MRMSFLAAVAAIPVLILAACAQPEPAPVPAEPIPAPETPPPATPAALMFGGVDLNQPFVVRGTEPFWAVAITPAMLDYSGVDRPQQNAANPGPVISGSTATYTVTTSLSNPLTVTLTINPGCSDGMSDTVYPLSATVVIGTETLTGCAGV